MNREKPILCRLLGPVAGALFASAAAAQGPEPPSPQEFLSAALQSDAYEIQAARIALIEAKDKKVRAFAREMLDAHTRTSADLRKAAGASSLEIPAMAPSPDQARFLSSLQSLRGPDFDKAYARQQFLAHTSALTTQQSYSKSGGDKNLRRAAQAAVPMIQHHLNEAKALSNEIS